MRIFIFCCAILMLMEANCNPIENREAETVPSSTPVSVGSLRVKRWGRADSYPKWPNAILYYQVMCNEFTPEHLTLIESALNEIQNKTCVRFERIYNDSIQTNYVQLKCVPDGGCKSVLGYLGKGPQNLNLELKHPVHGSCIKYRIIQHEFLHALGFKHEHNSYSRDSYIRINYENVKPELESYFNLDKEGAFQSYGCDYDYNSVMHVPSLKHSKNGLSTIEPLSPNYNTSTIGIAKSISDCDVTRINNMYCNKK